MNRLFPTEFSRLCRLLVGGGLAFLSGLAFDLPATGAETSRLWGLTGERWEADGRLPDYSYAGYRRGERPLAERRPDVSVKDFGAVGDGKTDDTDAFERALDEAGTAARGPRGGISGRIGPSVSPPVGRRT